MNSITLNRVSSVVLFVNNLEESSNWYSKLLGIEPTYFSTTLIKFELSSFIFILHPADTKTSNNSGNQITYFEVDNIQQTGITCIELGATFYRELHTGNDGSCVCQIRDPFGNVFGLIEKQLQ